MPGKVTLGGFEELVMWTVVGLGSSAYGKTIRDELERKAERQISLGAVYTTLSRLEQKGLVSSYLGDPTPIRGGRAKKFFRVTGAGATALQATRRLRAKAIGQAIPEPI